MDNQNTKNRRKALDKAAHELMFHDKRLTDQNEHLERMNTDPEYVEQYRQLRKALEETTSGGTHEDQVQTFKNLLVKFPNLHAKLNDPNFMVYVFKLTQQYGVTTANPEFTSVCKRPHNPMKSHDQVDQDVSGTVTPSQTAQNDLDKIRNDKEHDNINNLLQRAEVGEVASGECVMALVMVDKEEGGQSRAFEFEKAGVSAMFAFKKEGKCEAVIANGNGGGYGGVARGAGGSPNKCIGAVGILVVPMEQ